MALIEEDLRIEMQVDIHVIRGFRMQDSARIIANKCIECLDDEGVMQRNSCNRCSHK